MSSEELNCAEATKRLIDEEVKRLIDEAYSNAIQLLTANKSKLKAIAEALLEKETLLNEDVDEILAKTP
jgi:cell division protease FtsH